MTKKLSPTTFGIISITLIALFLRVWGAAWSLPYVDHPDEPAIVGVLLRMVQGDLNPKHFFYPTLIMYLQALVFKIHFWWGGITGLYDSSFTLPNSVHFYTTIPEAFVWSRVVTALLGTTTVFALATWAARFVGQREGLLAAGLLAFSWWAIVHDHYITVDGPSALMGLIALLAALQIHRHGRWRDYIVAGILIGLAAGSKYQNVLVAASVTLAHGLHWQRTSLSRQAFPRLMTAGILSAMVFLFTTPYIILAPNDFWHDITTLFDSYASTEIAHGDVTGAFPIQAYLRFYWHECLEPVPAVLAFIGFGVLWHRSKATLAIILLFPLLMVFSLLRPETHFYRNLLPTLPPLLLLSGIGGIALYDWARRKIGEKIPTHSHATTWGVALGLALALVPSVLHGVQESARLAQPDSRVVSQEYIHQHWHGIRVASELSHPLRVNGVAQSTYVHYLPNHPLAWYENNGFGVLMANSGRRKQEHWTPDYDPFLAAVNGEPISFGGRDSGMLGPRIDVFDLDLTPERLQLDKPQALIGPFDLLDTKIGFLRKQGDIIAMYESNEIEPGRTLAVLVFWGIEKKVDPDNYTIFLHMRDANGNTIVQRDAPPWLGLFPPETWVPGSLVSEQLDMWLPYEVPPGEYRLVMGMYDQSNWQRFPAFADGEHLLDDEVDLGVVRVVGE